jgi:tetratricopeptide (TPR) repeat protein
MKKINLWLAMILAIAMAPGCAENTTADNETSAEESGPVLTLPFKTENAEAQAQFISGLEAQDAGRIIDARNLFSKAVELDPEFVAGHFYRSLNANSLEDFNSSFVKAEELQANAPKELQLMIKNIRLGFDNDPAGALAAIQELVTLSPESPRAHLWLAGAEGAMNNTEASRNAIDKAISLAPNMASAYAQLGNSYLFSEPRDLGKALENFKKNAELEPEEGNSHDLLGDVYRAQGDLEKARAAYTEAIKYSGDNGSPYQQRGHVNSFLGDYNAARADYDKSISMSPPNQAASFGVYRAFTSVHAGDPAGAIEELKTLAGGITDENLLGQKIFALGSAVNISLHSGTAEEAEELIMEWAGLMRSQSEIIGTDVFKRGQEAAIAGTEGLLAIKKGDHETAEAKALEVTALVESDSNPFKMRPVHRIIGKSLLDQGDYTKAIEHLKQSNPDNNMYDKYLLAKALEGAGKVDEAQAMYNDIASRNFNSVAIALVRKEVLKKRGA